MFNYLRKLCCKKYNKSYLDDIEWKDTQVFTVPVSFGKVIKVYDGDTITIANKLPIKNSPMYRFSVRLDGIDAPEIKSKQEWEKMCARQAKDFLSSKILGKIVELKDVKNEKYGRILATVYLNDKNINQLMIDKKHAIKYNGGTKHKPNEWINVQV